LVPFSESKPPYLTTYDGTLVDVQSSNLRTDYALV
jgi:hypothetical protein